MFYYICVDSWVVGVGIDCDLRIGDKVNEGESECIVYGICRGI